MRRGRMVWDCAAFEFGSERLCRIYGRSELTLPARDTDRGSARS